MMANSNLLKNPDKIVDLFDKLYTQVTDRNKFLTKIRFYSLQRFSIRVIANLLIPLYFNLIKNNKEAKLPNKSSHSPKLIVSLTTFPARVKRVWIVIESILRQTHKPDMIILWLSKEYFKSMDDVPRKLRNLEKRGLKIRFVDDDIRAHKKYFYSLCEYPDDYIITLDDDIIYPTFIISKLVENSDKYPKSIICHRASKITSENMIIQPYINWIACNEEDGPSFDLFVTTGGGTLIPPHSFHSDVLNKELIKKLSFHSDDMWLNCMARLKNTSTVKTSYSSACLPIIYINNSQLLTINVHNGQNDQQLNAIRAYYTANLGIDPYWKVFANNNEL